ncbi:MAG TPA: LamG-like jellyroll fold domain-containing protein, partial [Pyrinomonadaceae bacterium]|nr:LamG-like jellyroll fold domain-containing protein [Pyrinomonadaceae bacterium]
PSDVQSVNTNASLVGDATYTNTGKVSRAFDLDGAGDYVRIEDNAAQRPATAVTAEGWFKFDSASGIVALISKPIRGSVLNSYTLYLDGGQLRGLVGNASQFTRANSSFSPQTGVWHHLAFTYNFSGGVSTLKLYANGTDVTSSVDGTPNLLPTYDANPYPLLIGGEFENDAPGFFLDGQADEVSVYGRALAQPEIFDIVQQGSFGKCPPPSCVQAPQGLVSSYSGEQNALDSRSNNHGIFTNAAYTNGKTGQAFNFNGTNSFVAAPDDNSLDITDDLTLEAWIRPTSYNPDGSVIVSKRDVNNFNVTYVFFMESDGRLNFSSRQNGNFSTPLLTTVAVPLNQFSHVAVTVQGSTAKIFIDGVERASTGANPTRTASDGRLTIGAVETAGCGGSGLCGFFPGQIDELSIYNRGLSISELQSIIAAGQSGKCKPVGLNPPSNQIAWFTADGETIDFMGLNPAGILRGDAGYRPGRVAQAFNFDGNGDYITTADSPNWDFGTGNFAVEGWFKSPAPTGTQRMISAGSMADGANNLWSFGYGDNPDWGGGQRLNFAVFNGGGYSDFSSNPVAFRPNTWHHIAVVRSGSSFNFYLDGALIGTVPVGAGFAVNGGSTGAIIGARYNNNPSSVFEFANGMLDEVSLYSRGLSASEIAAVYNAGVAGKLKGMANNTVPQFAPVLNEKQEREGETNQLRSIVELSDVTVNFFQATSVGTTTQSGIDLAFLPPLPSTVAFTGLAYDISTTATYTGGVHVCFNLPSINDATRFSRLRILHLENIGGTLIWVNRTANLQFASRTACTNSMSSLSPFAIVEGVAPTAASVTLSGRVQTSNGRGIRNARITMTDSTGQRRTVLTGTFGNYRITDVSVGQTVTIEAFAKKFSFVEPVQVVRVNEELREINFTSEK